MIRTLTLLALAFATPAFAQTCAVDVKGTAKLKDPHHVEYTVTVSNPTAQAITYNARADFFFKGQKLMGGFENLRGTIPARGKKVFKGSEAFTDKLAGADQVKVTRVRTCK